jgi:phospholipid/cholesterol/gamma-HCH transport system substrate-binding protein
MTGGFRWTALKLAIFTVVTIATTAYLAAIIGNLKFFSSPYEITAEFSDATGLLNGDVVKAAGVTIGRVEEIRIDDGLALVTMSIDEGTELPADIGAEIRFRNLVGQRMIALVPSDAATAGGLASQGDPQTSLIESGALIPLGRTESAFDLSELFNGLRPLIRSTNPEDINIVTTELVRALEGRSDEVEGIFSDLGEISEEVAARDRELGGLIDNLNIITGDLAARDAQLQRTLANTNQFLAAVSASRADLESALVNLDEAAQRLGRLVTNNDELIRAEVKDLATILDALEDKRKELRAIVAALPDFTVAVERVTQYGEWANQHLINVCKDDFGTCGERGTP